MSPRQPTRVVVRAAGATPPPPYARRILASAVLLSFVLLADVTLLLYIAPARPEAADLGPAAAPQLPSGTGLNVLVVSIDTLRADRLGSYGYSRPTSPNLDRFAAESVRFARTISQAPWTIPSHMSLFTSLFPSAHGVNRGFREFEEDPGGTGPFRPLRPETATLAQLLQGAGYRTFALTGGGTMSPGFGFERGFEEYVVGDAEVTENNWNQLQSWLDRPREQPFFLFFHTFEVHAPYDESELAADQLSPAQRREMDAMFANNPESPLDAQQAFLKERGLYRPEVTSALYDGGVAHADAFLGRLFDDLRARGLYDRTLIVVTSDHGEEFADHDPQRFYDCHCSPVYREIVRVPLLVRFPPIAPAGRVVERFVRLIDVAPTVLDLLDLPLPASFQGQSLEPLLAGGELGPVWTWSEAACVGPEVKSLRVGRYKYIATFELGPGGDRTNPPWPPVREELYDRTTDRFERMDLSASRPDELERMRRLFQLRARAITPASTPARPPSPAELTRRLRSLGYI